MLMRSSSVALTALGEPQMRHYSAAIEDQMRSFYQSLSEKDRRRYAAIEATKLGRGGIS